MHHSSLCSSHIIISDTSPERPVESYIAIRSLLPHLLFVCLSLCNFYSIATTTLQSISPLSRDIRSYTSCQSLDCQLGTSGYHIYHLFLPFLALRLLEAVSLKGHPDSHPTGIAPPSPFPNLETPRNPSIED